MLTIALYGVMIIAAGVAAAVLVRYFQRVKAKSEAGGVNFADGIQRDEVALIAKFAAEELADQRTLEDAKKALAIAKKIAEKLAKQVGPSA